jgi:hypothetical protein
MHGELERKLQRTFDPRGTPDDGLMLSLAAVAGELLHEVRQELLPEPKVAAPVSVAQAPTRSLSVRLAGEVYSAGEALGGGELSFRFAILPRVDLELFAGGRTAAGRSGAEGTVWAQAFNFGLAALVRLWRWENWVLGAQAAGAFSTQWFHATPKEGATTRPLRGWTAFVRGGVELAWHRGATLWALAVGAGAPARAYVVRDSTGTLAAIGGIEGYLSLSGGWAF